MWFVAAALCGLGARGSEAQVPTFREAGGLVVVEAESLGPARNFLDTNVVEGFTGDGYLIYTGPDRFNLPGRPGVLRFEVDIATTGTYRIQWRSRIGLGNSNTEHNDTWLRLRDASDFYAQEGDRVVYPKGSGKTPNPEGAGADGWFKVYQNQLRQWSWQTRTSDNDPHEIFARFDTTGTFLVEISGRSNGHIVDRFVMYHSSVPGETARALSQPESERATTGVRETALALDSVFPNPAGAVLTVRHAGFAEAGPASFSAVDAAGRALSLEWTRTGDDFRADVSALPAGQYVLRVETSDGALLTRTFLKR